MNTQNLLVGLLALLIGLVLGAAMFPVVETEVVYEQVLVPGEDKIVTVPVIDDRYSYYTERADIATSCVNYALDNWQEEIVITETSGNTTTTYDYDEYIEDGSEFDVEDYPNLNDVRRLLSDVTLSEVDHEDNEWTCAFQMDMENDLWNEATYNVSLTYEDGSLDDLEVILG
jgi:hypothetical protein